MAKCVIVVKDTKKGYRLNVRFDPRLKIGEKLTDAQRVGYEIAKILAGDKGEAAFGVLDDKFKVGGDGAEGTT